MPPKWREAEAAYLEAAQSYTSAENLEVQAEALLQAGRCAWRGYATVLALQYLARSLDLVVKFGEEIGWKSNKARALLVQGKVYSFRDHLREAEESFRQALSIYRTLEDGLGEASTLRALGDVLLRTDRLSEAEHVYNQALSVFRSIGDILGEANVQRAPGSCTLGRIG